MMNKNMHLLYLWLLLSLFICFSLHAQETFTLTTYYPAPVGVYQQIVTTTLGVGDNNGVGGIDVSDAPNPATNAGDVWVFADVGLGTTTARSRLDVSGAAIIGANLAGNTTVTAPPNGLLVEGDAGFGLSASNVTPLADLEVKGALIFRPGREPAAIAGQSLEGTVYYSDSDNTLRYHNGTTWRNVGGVTFGATAQPRRSNKLSNVTNTRIHTTCQENEVVTGVYLVSDNICPHDCCIWGGAGKIGSICGDDAEDGYDTGRIVRVGVICRSLQ